MASESFPRAMVDYNSILPMILVGGLGTRLHAIVSDRQKVIAQINGKPFLTFILDQLAESGFKHVMLCAGYKAEQIQALVGITYRCLRIQYSIEGTAAGTGGGAIRNALELTGSERKHILAMNGDSYLRIQLREFIKWYFDNNTRPSIALTTVKDVSRYGSIEIDENNSILQFSEKKTMQSPGLDQCRNIYFPKIDSGENAGHQTLLARD